MKVGINLLLWTATPRFEEHGHILDQLAAWGFDAFEINVAGLDAGQISKFAKKGDELGLSRTALDVYVAADMDVISPDEASRARAVQFLKDCISKTADLGANLFAGPMYQGLLNQTQIGPQPDERKWAVDSLREVALFARDKGVRIAAEPLNRFEHYLVTSVGAAYDFAMEVGVDNFGILADTHHSNIEEYDTAKAWAKVIDRIYHVHISESNRGIPGEGRAAQPEVFQLLKSSGYDGHVTIEAFNANVPEIKPALRIWRPFVDDESIIATRGLKFIRRNIA